MTWDQFWHGDPMIARYYYKSHQLSVNEDNQKLWLQGVYIERAIVSVVSSTFGKKDKALEYPREPLDIFPKTKEETETGIVTERERIIMQLTKFGKDFNNKR